MVVHDKIQLLVSDLEFSLKFQIMRFGIWFQISVRFQINDSAFGFNLKILLLVPDSAFDSRL